MAEVTWERAVLSLGANMGDPLGQLAHAVGELAGVPGIRLSKVSPVYRTAPVGGVEQPDFRNIAVLIDTILTPEELLGAAHEIEARAGRRRVLLNGPRTLDIDVIAMGQRQQTGVCNLPHPRAFERGFVLIPWLAIDPDAELPGRGMVRDLVTAIGSDGVEIDPEQLPTPGQEVPA